MKHRSHTIKNAGLAFFHLVQNGFARFQQNFLLPAWTRLKLWVRYLLRSIGRGASLLKAGITRIITNHSFGIELKAALFIASIAAILEHHHLLESLQQDNLQLALPFLVQFPPQAAGAGLADNNIQAILIDDLTYEKRFRQEAPLDRNELASIITQLLQHRPKVLVIDLDLSPGPPARKLEAANAEANLSSQEEHRTWSSAETALYRLLKQDRWSPATEIILTTPIPVLDPALAKTNADWMKFMCSPDTPLGPAKIRFGLPGIPVVSGIALNYDKSPSALAAEVNEAVTKSSSPHSICAQADLTRYTRKYAADANAKVASDLLNYQFASTITARDLSEACPAGNCASANINGSVLFLGGRYSPADTYSTPVGVLSGALLHAGSYYSFTKPIRKTNVVIAYLLDIIMGCMLGIIIYKLASLYRNQRSLGSIAMNLAVQPLFPYFMVVMSGLLLAHFNLWLNPAPMIFGMAIHAGLVRIEEPYIEDVPDQKILGISEARIKQVIYCAVVLVAWIYLADEMQLFA